MTLIIGIVDPEHERSYLCADSGVWDYSHVDQLVMPKVTKCGEILVALAGAAWQMHVARSIEQVPGDTPEAYVDRFMEKLAHRKELVKRVLGNEESMDWNMCIAHKMRVFDCGSDGGLEESYGGIVTAGSGRSMALGAATALSSIAEFPLHPLQVIERTMRLCEKRTDGCRLPAFWFATDGKFGRIGT